MRHAILFEALASLLVVVATSQALGSDLVAEWKFDEGKGEVARDSSGNGLDARLDGASWVKDGEGFSVRFDGDKSTVECLSSEKLNLTGPLTVEAWVKPIATGWGECHLIGFSSSEYMLNYSTRGMTWWLISSGTYSLGSKLRLGQWNHVAATFDGKMRALYVNGRLVGRTEAKPPSGRGGKFMMGADSGPCYNGLLDDVRVYKRALLPEQVLSRYREQAAYHGIDAAMLQRVRCTAYPYPEQGKIVVEVDYTGVQPLAGKGRVEVALASAADESKPLVKRAIEALPEYGWVDAELATATLPEGNYIINVSVSDDQGTKPSERIVLKYPQAATPPDPARTRVPQLAAPAAPAPFDVKLGAGGGFQIIVNGVAYPFESRISWPNGEFNKLVAGDPAAAAGGEKGWKVNIASPDQRHFTVDAAGDYYTIHRQIEVSKTRVYVKDTYTNKTDSDLGLLIYNETPLAGREITAKRLAGYEGGGKLIDGVAPHTGGPTVFVQDKNAGIGMVPLDDVYTIQSVIYIDKKIAGMGTEKFALAPKASYTLEWQIYPLGASGTSGPGDYWDFLNAFRKAEGRSSGVEGEAGFISYGPMNRRQVPDEDFVKNRNLKIAIISCLSRSADDPGISIEGIEFMDFPREMELTRQQAMALHARYPGMKVVFHNAHTLYATNHPERFGDSKLTRPDGTQAASGGPGSFSEKALADGWAWYVFYPTPGNKFHDALMKSVDVMMDQMGVDGSFVDGFLMGYGGRWTYDRWDGHSAEIDPKTKTIQRKIGSVLLLMQPSMVEYSRKIRDKGGVVIANGSVITRTIAQEKYILFDAECEAGPECHLAPNALSLALGPFDTDKDVYLDALDKLRWGVLYMFYNDRIPLTYPSLPSQEFPITFEEMRSGMVRGKERIVTMNSGVYGWPGDSSLHQVHLFDGRGAPATNRFTTTVDSDGARTQLDFAENESAVIERIPAKITAAAPVNVVLRHYSAQSLKMILNGHGEAALDFFVGSAYPDRRDGVFTDGGVSPVDVGFGAAYEVSINGSRQRIEERDGTLHVPLKLDGPADLSIAPAGRAN